MATLKLRDVPAQFGYCTATAEDTEDGRSMVTVEFAPGGGSEAKLSSGTDVVLVLDASFSMFVRAYRNARVIELVEKMIGFMNPYDDDGIDVYLHSLRNTPFRHLGAHSKADKVVEQLGEFMEARSAAAIMGQRTVCAPVIHDIVKRLKEEKGSDRIFIEIVTDGEFNDEAAVEDAIIAYGAKYNTAENPYGIRFHFTGIGAEGAKGLSFLDRLDNKLEQEYPGFIDCVQHNHAETVEQNIATIINELQQTVRLSAENAVFEINGVGGDVEYVFDSLKGVWDAGNTISWEGGLPVRVHAHARFARLPSEVEFVLCYFDGDAGQTVEHRFKASPG